MSSRDEILDSYGITRPDEDSKRAINSAMEEYSKQQAIAFRLWMDTKGYFAQWKDNSVGYIRQENQLVFSTWQPLENIYNLFLQKQ